MTISRICTVRIGSGGEDWHNIDAYVRSGHARHDAGLSHAPQLLRMSGLVHASPFTKENLEHVTVYQNSTEIALPLGASKAVYVRPPIPHGCLDEILQDKEQFCGVVAMAV